jgi:hypothetical protein
VSNYEHGASAYSNWGCRCDTCRKGWTASAMKLRRNRRARGLCCQCPNESTGGMVRCAECRAKIKARRQAKKLEGNREIRTNR